MMVSLRDQRCTGQKIWEYGVTYAVKSTPAVAGNTVYVGADDYGVYAIDLRPARKSGIT